MYPVAMWPENAFLAFYGVLFGLAFFVADILKYRSDRVRPIARYGISGLVVILTTLHLLSDLGTDRINKHWTGRAPSAATLTLLADLKNSEDYQKYWGENRRKIPFYSGKPGRRLVLLPLLFLATVIGAQLYFRRI